MEKFKNKRMMTIALVVVGVLTLSLGFAAFSSQLQIKSSLTVKPDESTFGVKFSSDASTLKTDPVVAEKNLETFSAENGKIANISNPTITNLRANFTAPGQTAVYKFYAMNTGKYTAYLNSITLQNATGASTNKVCTPGVGASSSMVDAACESISVSVQVEGMDATTTTQTGITDHPLAIGASELITVTISYAENGALVDGPFKVNFGDIYLVYSSITDGNMAPTELEYAAVIGETTYPTVAEAIASAQPGDTIDVVKSEELAGVELTKDLTLISTTGSTLSFSSATSGAYININPGYTLTLGDGITLSGNGQTVANRIINVRNGSSLVINDGATVGNNTFVNSVNAGNGGCIATYAGGNITMNGGTIENCKTAVQGGAVYVSSNSTFVMNDGVIKSSSARQGGAVYVLRQAEFTMNGGMIADSTASGPYENGGSAGGGVYANGIFNMTNGTIQNCSVINGKGGGVYVGAIQTSIANISSSKIIDCYNLESTNYLPPEDATVNVGGGIYVGLNSSATLNNTLISVAANDHGAYVHSLGTLTLNGNTSVGTVVLAHDDSGIANLINNSTGNVTVEEKHLTN